VCHDSDVAGQGDNPLNQGIENLEGLRVLGLAWAYLERKHKNCSFVCRHAVNPGNEHWSDRESQQIISVRFFSITNRLTISDFDTKGDLCKH
jgi:hypothetical protein